MYCNAYIMSVAYRNTNIISVDNDVSQSQYHVISTPQHHYHHYHVSGTLQYQYYLIGITQYYTSVLQLSKLNSSSKSSTHDRIWLYD